MIAASPYAASANASRRAHQRPLFEDSQSSSRRGSSAANTPSPAPSPSPSSTTSDNGAMSSTARLIFDTLEKMSTPVRDAQKLIPSVSCSPPRAEKRRLIAEQLDWSKDTLKRKRPNLGRDISGRNQLNGPPLRTIFSPVPASPRPRSNAAKSARLTATPKAPSSNVQPQKNLGESFTSKPVSLGAKAFLPTKPKIDLPLPAVNEGKSVIKPFASSTSLSQPATSPSKSLSVPAPSMTKSGKMRTKVSEPLRQKTTAEVEAEPLPNFLATSNASLPLKAMPTFDFGHTKEISASPPISRTSSSMTTTTLPLQRSSSSSDCLEDQNEDASFQFSNPSPVKWSDGRSPDDVVPNGIVFSFCQPKEVAPGSSSKTSPTAKAVYPKNHVQALPDLTMRSNNQQSPVAAPAKSLKQGSVMDILKRKLQIQDF